MKDLSQPNINVEALKTLLEDIIAPQPYPINTGKEGRKMLLDLAFPPQPKEEWKPEIGQKIWGVWREGKIVEEMYIDNESQRNQFILGFIHPTKEAAEAHLVKYKEWVKTI